MSPLFDLIIISKDKILWIIEAYVPFIIMQKLII